MFRRTLTPVHRVIAVLFGAVVVFNHFHCVTYAAYEAAQSVARMADTHAGQEFIDKGPSPRCKNESSCICRGALLVVAAPQPTLDLTLVQAITPVDAFLDASMLAGDDVNFQADFEPHGRPIPISGRILRAHLASFLK